MESIIVTNQGLKNLDVVDIELKNKAKTVVQIDLSHNYLV
jgi:hypothetical protein